MIYHCQITGPTHANEILMFYFTFSDTRLSFTSSDDVCCFCSRPPWFPSFSLSPSRLCRGCQTTKRLIYSQHTDGDTLGSFRRGNVEHVLPNSVTGEAALAGQGADRVLGEPCSLTKDMEHVALDFTAFLPPASLNPSCASSFPCFPATSVFQF